MLADRSPAELEPLGELGHRRLAHVEQRLRDARRCTGQYFHNAIVAYFRGSATSGVPAGRIVPSAVPRGFGA